jgi:branched-chain amino acid aminotransferase
MTMSMEDRDGYIWLDGELVPWREARCHVLTHTLHHGMGIFEGVRAYRTFDGKGAIFRLQDHTDRFFRSAHILQLRLPFSRDEINAAHLDTMRANTLDECYFRPIAFLGGERVGVSAKGNRLHVAVMAWRWDAYLGEHAKSSGVRIKTSSFTRHQVNAVMCKAKACGHYINSMLANSEATELGFDDALLLDSAGYVMEGSTSNVFIIRQGRIYTPDLTSALEGITRASVMTLAQDAGIPVTEKRITRDEMYIAEEAFFTGTASELTPIVAVDNRSVGNGTPGPITTKLQQEYFAAVRGEHSRSREWLTYVRP